MSQDLFAAFSAGEVSRRGGDHGEPQLNVSFQSDDFEQISFVQNGLSQAEDDAFGASITEQRTTTSTGLGTDNGLVDYDDFGDFEDASTSNVLKIDPQSTAASIPEDSVPRKFSLESRVDPKPFPKVIEKQPQRKSGTKQESTGTHPFAGRMDLLFQTGDDEYDAGADELADLSNNPGAAMAYSKRIIAEQQAAQSKEKTHKPDSSNLTSVKAPQKEISVNPAKYVCRVDSGPKKLTKRSEYLPAKQPEILFDAEDVSEHESDVDDFGDFEGQNDNRTAGNDVFRSNQAQKQETVAAFDLLGLDDSSGPAESSNGSVGMGFSTPSGSTTRAVKQTSVLPTMDHVSEHEDDDWDDFETSAMSDQTSSTKRQHLHNSDTQLSNHTTSVPTFTTSSPPPTNIPPPAVLLSLFPGFFSEAEDALFNAMGKLGLKQRQMLLGHPASHQFLKGYISHCTAFAHIIAGRKLRWKRDQRLSQSMRIGPAAVGGKGGMKLAGLDKSEIAKEDREVLEMVRLWKTQVGKLRTGVTAASSVVAMPKLPPVPEIAEVMPLKTLKSAEGGITAPYACALCGLRREERVAKVDIEVEDSFGEWWVQGTDMHISCKTFWEEFERKLK